MRTICSAALIIVILSAIGAQRANTRVSVDDIGKTVLVYGNLGQQVGEQMTITGHPLEAGVTGNEFVVESVNGESGRWGIIRIPGTKSWPRDTAATLRGCEIAEIRFYTGTNRGPEESAKPRQKAIITFKVREVVAPANLQLDER